MKSCGKISLIISSILFLSAAIYSHASEKNLEPIKGLAFDGTNMHEDSCQMLSSNGNEIPTLRDVPGMHVLNRTKKDPLVIFAVENVNIKGVVCWRFPAKFSENDFLVPEKLGYPLYIKTNGDDKEDDRTFVLEKIGGSFRIRLLSGADITSQEKVEIIKVLSYYEKQIKD